MLKRINEITEGDSSRANIALIKNNAKVGGEIAVAMHKIQQKKKDWNWLGNVFRKIFTTREIIVYYS